MTEVARWTAAVICWLAVGIHLRKGLWLLFPVFTLWMLCAGVYWSTWHGRLGQYFTWEPFMFALRVAAAAELFGLVSQHTPLHERRILFAICSAISAMVAFVYFAQGGFNFTSTLETFRSSRQLCNLALASAVGAGALLYWIQPPKLDPEIMRHALLVTALYILYAATGFVPRSSWPLQPLMFFGGATAILSVWAVATLRGFQLRKTLDK